MNMSSSEPEQSEFDSATTTPLSVPHVVRLVCASASANSKHLSCGQAVIMLQALADLNRNPELRKMNEKVKKSQSWQDICDYVCTVRDVTFVSRNGDIQREEGIVWNPVYCAQRLRRSWIDMKKRHRRKMMLDPKEYAKNPGTLAQLILEVYSLEEAVIKKRRALRTPLKFQRESQDTLTHKKSSLIQDVNDNRENFEIASLIEIDVTNEMSHVIEQLHSIAIDCKDEQEENCELAVESRAQKNEFFALQREYLDLFCKHATSMREQKAALLSALSGLVQSFNIQ